MVNKDTSELDSPTVAESKFCSFVATTVGSPQHSYAVKTTFIFEIGETSWSVIQTVLFSNEEDSNASGCHPSIRSTSSKVV